MQTVTMNRIITGKMIPIEVTIAGGTLNGNANARTSVGSVNIATTAPTAGLQFTTAIPAAAARLSSGGYGYPSNGGYGYPSNGGYGYPSSGGYGYPGGGYGYPSSGRGYPGGGGYGGGGNVAYSTGYSDGSYRAREDMNENKPFNPNPRGSNGNRDHGYHSQYGDKNAYRSQYTSGYESGYQANYRRRRQRQRLGILEILSQRKRLPNLAAFFISAFSA